MCVRDQTRALVVTLILAAAALADHLWPMAPGAHVHVQWVAAIPWIASAVGALASAYSNRQSSSAQNKALNQQGGIVGLQQNQANQLSQWGTPLMQQGTQGLQSLLPFYTKAAFGDRGTLQTLMRPELEGISQAYDRPLQSLTEVSPRTSATTADRMRILGGRAESMSDLLYKTRMGGMQGLAGVSGTLLDAGRGAVGASFGGLQGASSGNLGLLAGLSGVRAQNEQANTALGSAVVDFLKWYANRTPATGTGSSTPTGSSWGLPAGGGAPTQGVM